MAINHIVPKHITLWDIGRDETYCSLFFGQSFCQAQWLSGGIAIKVWKTLSRLTTLHPPVISSKYKKRSYPHEPMGLSSGYPSPPHGYTVYTILPNHTVNGTLSCVYFMDIIGHNQPMDCCVPRAYNLTCFEE